MMERLDNHLAGLPLCQECQELSGILEILPKSQENVRKIHEFLVMPGMSGIFYVVLSGDIPYFILFYLFIFFLIGIRSMQG